MLHCLNNDNGYLYNPNNKTKHVANQTPVQLKKQRRKCKSQPKQQNQTRRTPNSCSIKKATKKMQKQNTKDKAKADRKPEKPTPHMTRLSKTRTNPTVNCQLNQLIIKVKV